MPTKRKPVRRKRRRTLQENPIFRVLLAALCVTLTVLCCIGMTGLMPDTVPAQASASAAPTPVPTPTPEPTITPTPALYAPFGAQYGHGGADLIPATPTPMPTPTPAPTPLPTPTPVPAPTAVTYRTLRRGSTGQEVVRLQQALIELGYLNDVADGNFGQNTQTAVYLFQATNGLSADGLAGTQTQTLLFSGHALSADEAPEMDYVILVNRKNTLPENYMPTDLVLIESIIPPNVLTVKYDGMMANRTATEALGRMLQDAIDDGITVWQVSSAYRSHDDQQALVDNSVARYRRNNPDWSRDRCLSATYQTVAPTGTSEHQTGLAFDITVPGVSFTGTEQQKWLHEHCYEYGFIVRFTKEKEGITGFLAESWHFRYVGVEAAQIMYFNDWCLEEYVQYMGL